MRAMSGSRCRSERSGKRPENGKAVFLKTKSASAGETGGRHGNCMKHDRQASPRPVFKTEPCFSVVKRTAQSAERIAQQSEAWIQIGSQASSPQRQSVILPEAQSRRANVAGELKWHFDATPVPVGKARMSLPVLMIFEPTKRAEVLCSEVELAEISKSGIVRGRNSAATWRE